MGPLLRGHVSVWWGSAVTVIDDHWWLNCKVEGTGTLLHDLSSAQPFDENVGHQQPEVARRLSEVAVEEDSPTGCCNSLEGKRMLQAARL